METELRADAPDIAELRTLQWLALTLTPAVGASRGRKLVQLLNEIDGLFKA